mgnify:CR=1 FL=1
MNLIATLFIGALAGWLAGIVRKGKGFGLIGNIIIGLLGGFVGSFLGGIIGIEGEGFIANVLISTAGAVVLLFILNKFIA